MPKRKIVLTAIRGGKVNDEEIGEIEAAPSAPGTSAPAKGGRGRVIHEIRTIGRARALEFQIDPQTGHVVKTAVANGDDGEGDGEAE